MKKTITILTAILFIILAITPLFSTGEQETPSSFEPGTVITPDQARILLNADPPAILIDVRTRQEFSAGAIPHAILLPNTMINARTAEEVIPSLDYPVVLYCRSGNRSNQALRALVSLGYTRVYDMGAIFDWDGPLIKPD